jgi:hypothetical protein
MVIQIDTTKVLLRESVGQTRLTEALVQGSRNWRPPNHLTDTSISGARRRFFYGYLH